MAQKKEQQEVTVAQASETLGVSPQRVRSLIKAKRLIARTIGARLWLIDFASLKQYRVKPAGRPKKAA